MRARSPRIGFHIPGLALVAALGGALWIGGGTGCTSSAPPPPPCQGEATACVLMTTRCELQDGCELGPRCSDDPEVCEALGTQTACTAHAECAWTPGCVGLRDSCSTIDAAQTCDANVGCLWSTSAHACSGVPTPCEEISIGRCDVQAGCYVSGLCQRVAACTTYAVADCAAQPGCEVGEGCQGTVVPCSEFTTNEDCTWQVGCTWSPTP